MKRLYKSRKDKVIDGVCGGIAEYFGIDPTIIRLIWVLLLFAHGAGLILYLIAMIIIPREPLGASAENTDQSAERSVNTTPTSLEDKENKIDKNRLLMALIVIVIGFVLLMSSFTTFTIFSVVFGKIFLGVLLMAGGGYLLYKLVKEGE
ncbi:MULTISPECIES: PspC domain-containing protein [Kosmotoga]|jgi:phage shock protein C|uniref:Phage shock protein C, PspC n=1 Tax=Kosmotoga olearia (strain ATCC BAA-1733 / DSM 21960 / TBF 19.5.1) TaxID=521045 RepID=C5CGZ9_KOSOT|nr:MULTISPECIES: PspC domain-containing protein [Kosmotoga]ACR79664.1 phage shock protein C, PspC [Kosmotoga olearia TBF 19.5.1]MDI3523893.1 phage shock protein [Kosmotoga sp.]MDK2953677.1 phage shock protein [Kosmotoga sp.]OAA21903.1 phage-shock protein [Kosmotoga sp. DU53]